MKFVVSSALLLNHLRSISKVINSKNTLPILDCFLLDLKGNTLSLTAADNETRLETSVEVSSAEGEGRLAINAKNLLDPLSELPDQPLTFDVNDDTLEVYIYYHNGKYNFVGAKGDEYPQPKQLKEESAMTLSIDAQVLFSGINRTVFATADDELRPVMNGIYFDITTDDLTFVASDGHKLVKVTTKEAKGAGRSSFILPKKPANLLKSLLPKESGMVELKFDENNAYVLMSNYTMVCRFVEGRYPNYNSVIPKENPFSVTLDRLSLFNALKRVAVSSNPASGLVKLQLSEEKIVVSAQDIDFSISAYERAKCQYDGEDIEIGFKSVFLLEILANLGSEEVVMELADPTRAGLFLPGATDNESEDLLMLLMPMMINA
jgi:DNA polymerase-3 subunit beta